MTMLVRKFLRARRGATAIEYALIAAFIAMVVVTTVGLVGTKLEGAYNKVLPGLN